MVTSCCGGGRCYCSVVQGPGIDVTGTGAADNPFVITLAGAVGGGPFFYVDDYGALHDGSNDGPAIQSAIDAAATAGGGTVVFGPYTYSWSGDIVQKHNVTVLGPGSTPFPADTDAGLLALNSTARYRYGDLSGPGANPYPGPLLNLNINGNDVGGAAELLRAECVNANMSYVSVVNGAGDGVVFAAAQNSSFTQGNIHNFPNGAALAFRNRDDGGAVNTQGAGSCRVSNLHVTSANVLVTSDYVITNGALPASFWPHDNMVSDSIFEQYQDVYHSLAWIRDGEIQFDKAAFTGSSGTGPNASDCVMLVENAIRPTSTTKVTMTNSYLGGGAATPTDAIRSNSYGLANTVRLFGMTQIANVDYLFCDDRAGGGAGLIGGLYGTVDGALTAVARGINGGTLGGFLSLRRQPTRWETDSAMPNPVQVRRDTDSSNRWQVTRDGNQQWTDGTSATIRASIVRSGSGLAINGSNVIEIIAYTTVLRPAAASLPNYIILDVTLGILIWSDGTNWRNVGTGAVV